MISAFQVMLPTAIKATYKKRLQLRKQEEVAPELLFLFQDKEAIDWEAIETQPQLYRTIQQEIKHGTIEVVYQVKDKVQKKKQRVVQPELPEDKLELAAFELKSKKQQDVLYYFVENYKSVPLKVITEELQITDAPIKALVKKGLLSEKYVEVYRNPYDDDDFEQTKPFPLTEEQKQVITPILSSITNETYNPFLLYGVTGSGKTEVYLQSIAAVLEKGKEAIVLVPEIALTPQMVDRFKGRFGSQVAVLHSALSVGEKYDEWRKILRKEVKVVVGARSAVFAPFENLGIIIIDEEHESSYKQEDNPRYHARDVAVWRGQYHKCPIVLGSATPTLESFARAKKVCMNY